MTDGHYIRITIATMYKENVKLHLKIITLNTKEL
jgi:hypothetical protein